MAEPRIWTELLTYGLGVALSPIHIVLLLLLLLGGSPLRRGGLFVGGWLLTSALAVIGLLTLGHGLLLDMTHGSDHRTGLDLIGGGTGEGIEGLVHGEQLRLGSEIEVKVTGVTFDGKLEIART